MSNKRPPFLTPEDQALWETLSQTVTPLPQTALPPALPSVKVTVSREYMPPPFTPGNSGNMSDLPFLEEGMTAGLDRRTAQRLKQGKYPIDATLDLHHHTRDQAYEAVSRLLHHAATTGQRCLLIITGKGRHGEESGEGLLRSLLPSWLNTPENREKILFFTDAHPRHGGSGAVYVFLRKQK